MTNFLMNAFSSPVKRLFGAAFVFLGLGLTAQAQIGSIPAITPDYQVPGTTITAGTANTGTDGLIFTSGTYVGQSLQVMTWDSPSPNTLALTWSIQNGTAPPTVSGGLSIGRPTASDPDVVVAQDANGTIWANLVYTQLNGGKRQTMYEVYKWNSPGFSQVGFPIPLGDPLYDHSFPNIDANANGLIGIVWQQQRTVTAQVQVSSLSGEFATFTYPQVITFNRSYLVTGTITGSLNYCNNNNGSTRFGAPVSDPGQLIEQTLQPDVAVSEGTNATSVVSVSYVRHYVNNDASDPAYRIKDELVIKQFAYGACKGGGDIPGSLVPVGSPSSYSWELPGLNEFIVPRIAASNSGFTADVEVALAWIPGLGCGGGTQTYQIRNYGKSQGVFRPVPSATPLVVSQPNSSPTLASQIESRQPAISYVGGTQGNYAITWTGRNYPATPGTAPGDDFDVLGVTMNSGQFVYPTGPPQPTPYRYSFVNQVLKLAQRCPSVAGRHLYSGSTMHLFRDDYPKSASFKASNGTGGSTPYRLAPAGGGTQPATQPAGPGMGSKAYPNPADGTVYLQVPLREGERVQQVLVTDALGRTVDRLPVAADASNEALTWKPAAQLPAGSYFFKLTTTQRSESIPVHRN